MLGDRHSKGEILVADDSPLARRRVAVCLTLAGYDVTTTSDGQEALERARSQRLDLIFLDAAMPRLSTQDIVVGLKGSRDTAPIPIVVMVPRALDTDSLMGRGLEYDFLLHKPIGRDDLLTVARSLIKSGREARASLPASRVVRGLGGVLEVLDPDTRDHSHRVGEYAYQLGERLGLTLSECEELRWGAFLHDIGKVRVGGAVLSKSSPLTSEEMEIMREHPSQGARILEGFGVRGIAGKAIRHHHERWDGKGYPDRLRGEAIPQTARILAVVNAFDAIVCGRPYQEAVSYSRAFDLLSQEKGRQFDPHVVDAFLEMVAPDMVASKAGKHGRSPEE